MTSRFTLTWHTRFTPDDIILCQNVLCILPSIVLYFLYMDKEEKEISLYSEVRIRGDREVTNLTPV
jgi:hypothetical protein